MRAEHDNQTALTALWRGRKTVLGFVGGRCTKTGTVQFPRSDIGVNANDHSIGTQEDYPLADVPAKVMTWTADELTYSPDPPNIYGNVYFVGGWRLFAAFTDLSADSLEVGDVFLLKFRIKAFNQ